MVAFPSGCTRLVPVLRDLMEHGCSSAGPARCRLMLSRSGVLIFPSLKSQFEWQNDPGKH